MRLNEINDHDFYQITHCLKAAGLVWRDVEEVFAFKITEGDYGEADVRIVATLRDGYYVYVSGGCDVSGWECLAGAEYSVAKTWEELWNLAMDTEGRAAFPQHNPDKYRPAIVRA